MKAIRVNAQGGPEKMVLEEIPTPALGAREVLIHHEMVGVNFSAKYIRTGQYKIQLPFTPGREASGVVEAAGQDVQTLRAGDRVAYTAVLGSYAEYAAVPEDKAVKLPDDVDFTTAAAVMNQGMTAQYLLYDAYPVQAGETCLIHAGAGGLGQMLIQLAKRRGATVLTTVSTEEKARIARALGADHVIRYTEQDFAEEAQRLTGGKGVDVIYDAVAATTFDKGLDALKHRGMMVLCGQSAGPPPPLDWGKVHDRGLYLTRGGLGAYTRTREEYQGRAAFVLELVRQHRLRVNIFKVYPLAEAREAHAQLEQRATTGKLLLKP
ncbi:MAG: quinone oxidoreductase [Candidatus Lambdaproteobacteria bacterium]|nr:quinone oxidoreductase [Candidatus Lambdaproteobacteria bacterium]